MIIPSKLLMISIVQPEDNEVLFMLKSLTFETKPKEEKLVHGK
jgi:hypothetical protein